MSKRIVVAQRGLPHGYEVERALLGGLLLNADHLSDVRAIVAAEHFHRPSHAALYRLMCRMADAGTTPDPLTVCDYAETTGPDAVEAIGGIAYVTALPQACMSVDSLPTYARRVRLTSARAQTIQRIREMEERLQTDPDADPAFLLSAALDEAERNRLDKGTWHSYADIIPKRLEHMGERAANPGQLPGISTGFRDLDLMTGGLEPGCVYGLGGRPSMGKSLVSDLICATVARNYGPVAKFQLEMAKEKVAERVIIRESRVDNVRVRKGDLDNDAWTRLLEGAETAAGLPIYIDDTPGLSIEELRSRARALKRQVPDLQLIEIDYLQLVVSASIGRNARGDEKVGAVSKLVKVMAKELGVPVIVVLQLSRAVESRDNKRPMMSDVRESGQIEQDLDALILAYRDEYYNKEASQKPGIIELIVAKSRDGNLGTIERRFRGEFYTVDEIDTHHEPPPNARKWAEGWGSGDEDGGYRG